MRAAAFLAIRGMRAAWIGLLLAVAATNSNAGPDWGGAAGTWFWIDPKNDLIFVGLIQVMDRWKDPQLKDIDTDSSALVYSALVSPGR
jgi:CubicO group peptidase (beta-lactamase class C family)